MALQKTPSYMFDRALNDVICFNCLLTGKKIYILKLCKLIDKEAKYTRSAKKCHL